MGTLPHEHLKNVSAGQPQLVVKRCGCCRLVFLTWGRSPGPCKFKTASNEFPGCPWHQLVSMEHGKNCHCTHSVDSHGIGSSKFSSLAVIQIYSSRRSGFLSQTSASLLLIFAMAPLGQGPAHWGAAQSLHLHCGHLRICCILGFMAESQDSQDMPEKDTPRDHTILFPCLAINVALCNIALSPNQIYQAAVFGISAAMEKAGQCSAQMSLFFGRRMVRYTFLIGAITQSSRILMPGDAAKSITLIINMKWRMYCMR